MTRILRMGGGIETASEDTDTHSFTLREGGGGISGLSSDFRLGGGSIVRDCTF